MALTLLSGATSTQSARYGNATIQGDDPPMTAGERLRVLLVDDYPDAREMCREFEGMVDDPIVLV